MRTDELINALVADLTVSKVRFRQVLAVAMALGAAIAGVVFFSWIGLRPDFSEALETVRFIFKFVFTLSLAVTAAGLLARLARPGVAPGPWAWAWISAPALLAAAVAIELLVTPEPAWFSRLVGSNARLCLLLIPLLSAGPLGSMLVALRQGAPTRPGLAGALAGIVAGGIGATFYAAHCADDSPLFVASWYSLAIGVVASIGYLAGSRWLRW